MLNRTEADRLTEGEAWLARRLSRHGVMIGRAIFEGLTDSNIRKERLRQVIRERALEHVRIVDPSPSTPRPRTITYAKAFERLYGEPL